MKFHIWSPESGTERTWSLLDQRKGCFTYKCTFWAMSEQMWPQLKSWTRFVATDVGHKVIANCCNVDHDSAFSLARIASVAIVGSSSIRLATSTLRYGGGAELAMLEKNGWIAPSTGMDSAGLRLDVFLMQNMTNAIALKIETTGTAITTANISPLRDAPLENRK